MIGTGREKYVRGSEEDIKREMGSCAEAAVRAETERKRSGAEGTGNLPQGNPGL